MANWSGFTLTDVGADLQAKINAGLTTLKFTKVGVGSGSGSGSVNALTAMVHKEQDIGIGNVEANGNIVTINFTLTNKGLGSAYQMRELGLFATDPDKGEVLFAYMTDSTPDTMPADGSATVVSLDVTLNITFSNTGNVSATIDTGAFVTHEDLTTHNSTEDAHSAAFAAHNTDEQAHSGLFQKVKTELATHNTDSSAHEDIRQMFNNYLSREDTENQLFSHNTDPSAHTSILNSHNADVNAHNPILNAIEAITGTSSYDVAPSKTIAAMIPLLGSGGIVAQRLETGGYIKFANGLIIQWDFVSMPQGKYYSQFSLPIACNLFAVLVSDSVADTRTSAGDQSLCWSKGASSATEIRITTNTGDVSSFVYIAIGISV